MYVINLATIPIVIIDTLELALPMVKLSKNINIAYKSFFLHKQT